MHVFSYKREKDYFGDRGVEGRIILRWFRKWNVGVTGLSWPRTGTDGGALLNAVMNLRVP